MILRRLIGPGGAPPVNVSPRGPDALCVAMLALDIVQVRGAIRQGDITYLDEALPSWDQRERHRIPYDAAPAAVMRAAEQVTWREVTVFRGLMAMRSPGCLHLTPDEPVFVMFVGAGFEVLARTPEEILVGGIRRFFGSRTTLQLPRPDLAAFRDFDDPGCIKIGLNFRCAHGMLTTETRVSTTDARSRWLFGLYWLFIRGGSGLIRHVWLRAIRRRARLLDQRSGTAAP